MKTESAKVFLIKHPSAYFPVVMSLTALALVLGHAAIFGVVHEADEGAAAHIFQILMAAQVPIVAYFLIRWFPSRRRESARVLALLVGLWIAAFVVVYWLT